MADASTVTRAAVEAVWRIEAAQLIGGLVRYVRDLDCAEDLAQETLLAALEHWPERGVPDNPGAWLMTAAKRRAVDEARRRKMRAEKHLQLEQHAELALSASQDADSEPSLGDDVLRLVFIACHPVLSRDSRVALTLRWVAGLPTAAIARAFLTSEATMAQRLVRAKRTLSEARVSFELPVGDELEARVAPTLEVVYLIFNEGYAATAGADWVRSELCEEAMRLGRRLVGLLPNQAEVHGLLALMELQASRLRARVGADKEVVLLEDQDRMKWDRLLITRGLQGLERVEALGRPLGPYALQAAIAACHARASSVAETDWPRIVALYDALVELTGSPVVELNRAVAVAKAFGAEEALELVEELADDARLRSYHWLPVVRASLLFELGRRSEAELALETAIQLTTNDKERELLRARAAAYRESGLERTRADPGRP